MCGIFGIVSESPIKRREINVLSNHARQRGSDSSGLIYNKSDKLCVARSDTDIKTLMAKTKPYSSTFVLGHSRLITNGLADNQPVIRDNILVLHNGIIVNDESLWTDLDVKRKLEIDSEIIAAIVEEHLIQGGQLDTLPGQIFDKCKGTVSAAIFLKELGKLLLLSNNGSLYVAKAQGVHYFSSESFPLKTLHVDDIKQLKNEAYVIDLPRYKSVDVVDEVSRTENLIPRFHQNTMEEGLLQFETPDLRRCSRCILPETMPFIAFDDAGVCNYCTNYTPRNTPKPKEELFSLVERYRREGEQDCIVPFSGGRDSCYGLHLIVEELKMKPITYTYDWGMVTDLGRRNISRVCAKLGVENIIIAADISKKRRNIKMNLEAWLKSPHLGMMALLTAGDKHFFRHVETVKRQTGVALNLWGVNPLEVTHFKTGFLGIPPDFHEKHVYSHGMTKQLFYHYRRTLAMFDSPAYFNSSLWDTLSGEYYRSFTEKTDYFHIFDYWRWDEREVDETLLGLYEWEKAPDTTTTWRIGDGTAAFYNYVYHTVAGFTEHDTFRSNQIREGDLTREEALKLVSQENQPRYQNIRWYLDALQMDFSEVIDTVNRIPKLYSHVT